MSLLTRTLDVARVEGIGKENALRVRFQPAYDTSKRGQPDQYALVTYSSVIIPPKPPLGILHIEQDGAPLDSNLSVEAIFWDKKITVSWSAPIQDVSGWYTLEAWQEGAWRYLDRALHNHQNDRLLKRVPVYCMLGDRPREVKVYARPTLDEDSPGQFVGTQSFSARIYNEGRGPWDAPEINYFRSEMEKVDVLFHVTDPKKTDYLNLFRPIVSRVEPSLQHVALYALLELSGRKIFPSTSHALSTGGDNPEKTRNILLEMRRKVAASLAGVDFFERRLQAHRDNAAKYAEDRATMVANNKKIEDLRRANAGLEQNKPPFTPAEYNARIDKNRQKIAELEAANAEIENTAVEGIEATEERNLNAARAISTYAQEVYRQSLIDFEYFVSHDNTFEDKKARVENAQNYLVRVEAELNKMLSFHGVDLSTLSNILDDAEAGKEDGEEKEEEKEEKETANSFLKRVIMPPEIDDVPTIFERFMREGAWPANIHDRLSSPPSDPSPWLALENLSKLQSAIKNTVSRRGLHDISEHWKTLDRVAVQIREAIAFITRSGSFLLVPRLGRENAVVVPPEFVTPRTRVEFHDGSDDPPQICYLSFCSSVGGRSETPREQLNRPAREASPYLLQPSSAVWMYAKLPAELRGARLSPQELEWHANRALNLISFPPYTYPTSSKTDTEALKYDFGESDSEEDYELESASKEEEEESSDLELDDGDSDTGYDTKSTFEKDEEDLGDGDGGDENEPGSSVTVPPPSKTKTLKQKAWKRRDRQRQKTKARIGERMGSRATVKLPDGQRRLRGSVLPRKRKNIGLYVGVSPEPDQDGYVGFSDVEKGRLPVFGVRYYTWEEGPVDLGSYRMGDVVTMDASPFVEKGEVPLWSPAGGQVLHYDRPPYVRSIYQNRNIEKYTKGKRRLVVRAAHRSEPTSWLLRFKAAKNTHSLLFRWQVERPSESEVVRPIQRVVKEFSSFHGFDATEEGVLDFHYEMPHVYEYALALERLCNYYGADNQPYLSLVKEDLRCWPGVTDQWAPPYLRYTPDLRLLPDPAKQLVLFNPLSGRWVLFSTPEAGRPLLEAVRDLNAFTSDDPYSAAAAVLRNAVIKERTFDENVRPMLGPGSPWLADETGLPGGHETLRQVFLIDVPAPGPLLPKVLGATVNDSFVLWVERTPEMRESLAHSPHYSALKDVPIELLLHWVLDWIERYQKAGEITYSERLEELREVWAQMTSRLNHFEGVAARTPEHALSLKPSHIHSTHRAAWKPYLSRLPPADKTLLSSPALLENPREFDPRVWRYTATIQEIQDSRDFLLPLGSFRGEVEESPGDFSSRETEVRAARKLFEIRLRRYANSAEDRAFREAVAAAYARTVPTPMSAAFFADAAATANPYPESPDVERLAGPLANTSGAFKDEIEKYANLLRTNGAGVSAVSPYALTPSLRGVLAPAEKESLPASFGMSRTDITLAKWLQGLEDDSDEEVKEKTTKKEGERTLSIRAFNFQTPQQFYETIFGPLANTQIPSYANFIVRYLNPYRAEVEKRAKEAGDVEDVELLAQAIASTTKLLQKGVAGVFGDEIDPILSEEQITDQVVDEFGGELNEKINDRRMEIDEDDVTWGDVLATYAHRSFVSLLTELLEKTREARRAVLLDQERKRRAELLKQIQAELPAAQEALRAVKDRDIKDEQTIAGDLGIRGDLTRPFVMRNGQYVVMKAVAALERQAKEFAESRKPMQAALTQSVLGGLLDSAKTAYQKAGGVKASLDVFDADMLNSDAYGPGDYARAFLLPEIMIDVIARKRKEIIEDNAEPDREAMLNEAENRRRENEENEEATARRLRKEFEQTAQKKAKEREEASLAASSSSSSPLTEWSLGQVEEAKTLAGINDVTIWVVGDKGVGKSSLIKRYVNDLFTGERDNTPGGVTASVPVTLNDNTRINVTFKEAQIDDSSEVPKPGDRVGVVGVFDITVAKTFDTLFENGKATFSMDMTIGNKIDERDRGNSVISSNRGMDSAKNSSSIYEETSARENLNVQRAFNRIIEQLVGQSVKTVEQVKLVTTDLTIDAKITRLSLSGREDENETLGQWIGVKSAGEASSSSASSSRRTSTGSVWIDSDTDPVRRRDMAPKTILRALYGQALFFAKEETIAADIMNMKLNYSKNEGGQLICQNCLFEYNQGQQSSGIKATTDVNFTNLVAAGLDEAETICITVGQLHPDVFVATDDKTKNALKYKTSPGEFKLVFLGVDTEKILHILLIPGLLPNASENQDRRPYYDLTNGDWDTAQKRLDGREKLCPPILNFYKHATDKMKHAYLFTPQTGNMRIELTPRILTRVSTETAQTNKIDSKLLSYRAYNQSGIETLRGLYAKVNEGDTKAVFGEVELGDGEYLLAEISPDTNKEFDPKMYPMTMLAVGSKPYKLIKAKADGNNFVELVMDNTAWRLNNIGNSPSSFVDNYYIASQIASSPQ